MHQYYFNFLLHERAQNNAHISISMLVRQVGTVHGLSLLISSLNKKWATYKPKKVVKAIESVRFAQRSIQCKKYAWIRFMIRLQERVWADVFLLCCWSPLGFYHRKDLTTWLWQCCFRYSFTSTNLPSLLKQPELNQESSPVWTRRDLQIKRAVSMRDSTPASDVMSRQHIGKVRCRILADCSMGTYRQP